MKTKKIYTYDRKNWRRPWETLQDKRGPSVGLIGPNFFHTRKNQIPDKIIHKLKVSGQLIAHVRISIATIRRRLSATRVKVEGLDDLVVVVNRAEMTDR
jgi:hypothetical protein